MAAVKKQKKVLLTGANGFVGRAILGLLDQASCQVTLAGRSVPAGWDGNFIALDLPDRSSVQKAFSASQEFDVVIHAAGSIQNNCMCINHDGTRNLLLAIGSRSDLWIQIGSAGVHRNDLVTDVNETTVCEQITEYERSKWLADQEVVARHSAFAILKPTMVAGVGMKGSPLRLLAKAVSMGVVPRFDKDACLNMVHVNDVALAVLHFCMRENGDGAEREYILSDDILLSEVIGIMASEFQKSARVAHIPDFILKIAAGAGSALGVEIFNQRRYAILNNRAHFSSARLRNIMPQWPKWGSRLAVQQFCKAFQNGAFFDAIPSDKHGRAN